MNGMRFHLLRVAGIGVVAIAVPQLASRFRRCRRRRQAGDGADERRAKEPGRARAISENKVPGCSPSKGTCGKPHHRKNSGAPPGE